MAERMRGGWDQANSSFIWWIEARREACSPDASAMKSLMQTIWDNAWPERCLRMKSNIVSSIDQADYFGSGGQAGALMFGPYMPLRRGTYNAEFQLRFLSSAAAGGVMCDIVAGDGSKILARQTIEASAQNGSETVRIPFNFSLEDTTSVCNFECSFRNIARWKYLAMCS